VLPVVGCLARFGLHPVVFVDGGLSYRKRIRTRTVRLDAVRSMHFLPQVRPRFWMYIRPTDSESRMLEAYGRIAALRLETDGEAMDLPPDERIALAILRHRPDLPTRLEGMPSRAQLAASRWTHQRALGLLAAAIAITVSAASLVRDPA